MRDLLPILYKDVKMQVKGACRFDRPGTFCTLATDGWKAPDGSHLRNYMIVMQDATFMHSSTVTGTKSMNAKNICTKICNAIDEIGNEKVISVVTDNASSETTSWDHIRKQEKKEDIYCALGAQNMHISDTTTQLS